MKLKIKKELN